MITSDLRLQAFDLCWIPSGGIRDPKLNGASSPVLLLPGNSELAMDSSYGVLAVEVAKGRSLKEYKYFQTDIKRDISNPGRSISCGVVLVNLFWFSRLNCNVKLISFRVFILYVSALERSAISLQLQVLEKE